MRVRQDEVIDGDMRVRHPRDVLSAERRRERRLDG
jgi:hypothetical protein